MRNLMRGGAMVLLTAGWILPVCVSTSGGTRRGSGESLDYGQDTAKSNGRGAIGAICQAQSYGSCRIRSVVKGGNG